MNTKFRLAFQTEKAVDLELAEVQSHGDAPGQTERFSALFRGPLDHFLPQGTYGMEHERLGSAEIFIVPVRKDAEGIYYEAVFNRVK